MNMDNHDAGVQEDKEETETKETAYVPSQN